MATTKVVDILDRASIILQDSTNVRFPNAELLKFFNDAQKEVVLHRPDANNLNQAQCSRWQCLLAAVAACKRLIHHRSRCFVQVADDGGSALR